MEDKNNKIKEFRENGKSFNQIASILHIPIGTVKSYCSRNKILIKEKNNGTCLNCGRALVNTLHHKSKKFCSDKCRLVWWGKNRDKLVIKNELKVVCPVCNKEFYTPPYKVKKFCCRECYNKGRVTDNGY